MKRGALDESGCDGVGVDCVGAVCDCVGVVCVCVSFLILKIKSIK